jgi:hypothetical protein
MMRIVLIVFTALFFLTFIACKKEMNKKAELVVDCTGTYLRINEKDYKVCNLENTASFQDGQVVTATFKKIDECSGSGNFVVSCEMIHEYESWIEVIKIK